MHKTLLNTYWDVGEMLSLSFWFVFAVLSVASAEARSQNGTTTCSHQAYAVVPCRAASSSPLSDSVKYMNPISSLPTETEANGDEMSIANSRFFSRARMLPDSRCSGGLCDGSSTVAVSTQPSGRTTGDVVPAAYAVFALTSVVAAISVVNQLLQSRGMSRPVRVSLPTPLRSKFEANGPLQYWISARTERSTADHRGQLVSSCPAVALRKR